MANPTKVNAYMSGGEVNYLNMTLTLGLCLTFSLVNMVLYYYYSNYRRFFIAAGLSSLFFITLMAFAARGVLLFPPLIALFIAFSNSKRHKKKLVGIIILFCLLLIVAFFYFMNNASEYALAHMTGLVEDTEDESRLRVWARSIQAIIDNLWLFWGAGLNGFKEVMTFYPHNIFLHLLADFGIIPMLLFLYISFLVCRGYAKIHSIPLDFQKKYLNIITFAAFAYYLMTFSKSFSLYDCCPFLISISFCLKLTSGLRYKNYKFLLGNSKVCL